MWRPRDVTAIRRRPKSIGPEAKKKGGRSPPFLPLQKRRDAKQSHDFLWSSGNKKRGNGLADRKVVQKRAAVRRRHPESTADSDGGKPHQTAASFCFWHSLVTRIGLAGRDGLLNDSKVKKQPARSNMRKRTRVILATMGIAGLASPVMAQAWWSANVPLSTDNVFWGLAYGPAYVPPAYGSVARRAGRLAPGFVVVAPPLPRILDCVHVTFPQCSGGASGG
jgi:hypothetical protein